MKYSVFTDDECIQHIYIIRTTLFNSTCCLTFISVAATGG